jgi:ribosomal protein S18 acetylase RimI-like enzyme
MLVLIYRCLMSLMQAPKILLMEIIQLTHQNIEDQHICCAFSDKKCAEGYQKKKAWLKTEFKNGYTFRKLDARGKVFIEYVPIEYSWLPIDGQNFMVINCFWVSGQFKGKGYGKALLNQCKKDAAKMDGIIAVSSDKKRPFMSDPKFLKKQGFEIIDEAPPFFKLWGYQTNPKANLPQFKSTAKAGACPKKTGIVAYYSDTCPFNDYYINQHLRQYAERKKVPLQIHHIKSQQEGHQMPIPWILSSIFYEGELISIQLKADKQLDPLITS